MPIPEIVRVQYGPSPDPDLMGTGVPTLRDVLELQQRLGRSGAPPAAEPDRDADRHEIESQRLNRKLYKQQLEDQRYWNDQWRLRGYR